MTILAVDLAAKYSAVCLMNDDYEVLAQFDSFGKTEDDFIYQICKFWMFTSDHELPVALVIEDLPHGLPYTTLVKTVLRLQGRIVQAMHETTDGTIGDIIFVAPNTWRSHYEGMERGTGPQAVFPVSESFGYLPPEIAVRTKGNGGKTRAAKIASDYCSAYLIARWAIDTEKEIGILDVPGTSRYNTAVIRKKDFDGQNS